MAKPTLKPDWATSGGTHIIEPTSGLKLTGWEGGDRPPCEYQNWLHYITNQWINYTDKKFDALSPITPICASTLLWNGSTIVFTQPIQIQFRYQTNFRINQISNSASPLTFSDGDCLVFKRDNSASSPVTLTTQSYGSLTAGHYVIVAGASLTSTTQEDETILFRRNGSSLEIPMLGIVVSTGSTFSLGQGDTWTIKQALFIGNDGTPATGSGLTQRLLVGSVASGAQAGVTFVGNKTTNEAVADLYASNAAIGGSDLRLCGFEFIRNGANNTGRIDMRICSAGTLKQIIQFIPEGLSMQTGCDLFLVSGQYLRFDGSASGDTHIRENGANRLDVTAGGTLVASFNQGAGNTVFAQELLLPAIDPPTAKYFNSNSGVHVRFITATTGATVGTSGYNLTSTTRTSNPGIYSATLTTAFSNTTWTAVGCSSIADAYVIMNNATGVGTSTMTFATRDSTGALVNAGIYFLASGAQ